MNNIEETFKRNITKEKILKLKKVDFIGSFFKGSDYEEDYNYLKNELPEFLPKLQIKDSWMDHRNVQRISNNNSFLIAKERKKDDGFLIYGEIKFDENGKVLFARYSEDAMFSRIDSFIINNKEILKGTVPNSENCFPSKNTRDSFNFYAENSLKERFEIEYNPFYGNLEISLKTDEKEIILRVNYIDEVSEKTDVCVKDKKTYNNDDLGWIRNPGQTYIYESRNYELEDKYLKKTKKDLLKIIDIHKDLKNNEFKSNELNSYLQIYNIFQKKLKNL